MNRGIGGLRQGARTIAVLAVGAAVACGPGSGTSGSEASSSSETTPPSSTSVTDSNGSTMTGPSQTTTEGTTATSTTAVDGTATTLEPTTTGAPDVGGGRPVECADEPPADVPEPPPGCQHIFLLDDVGQPDMSRPSGYWSCGDERGGGAIYRVAAVACNCEYHHPACSDGTPEDCGSDGACGPGQSCVDFFGNGLCGCEGECREDSDCQSGEVCLCASRLPELQNVSPTNRCVPADCVDDSECPGDERCKIADDICYIAESLRCTTPVDDCSSHSDCDTQYCRWDEIEEFWTCDQGAICE